MRNSALNEKMRLVDFGVATCIDAILKNSETLQGDNLTQAQAQHAKAEIRRNANIYKQALEELLAVIDEPQAENANDCPMPKVQMTLDSSSYLDPINVQGAKTLDDKLNTFHSLFLTYATLPEIIQHCETNKRLALVDIAEIYKVYGAFLSSQFSHLHHFAQTQGGNDE